MKHSYSLRITDPADAHPTVSYARHFTVAGVIEGESPLPCDARLTVFLKNERGQTVRHALCDRKNGLPLYTDHPQLTRYADALDPDLQGLKDFGFPELSVKDPRRPLDSLRDATLKCFYSDDCFKAIVVTATDAAHGLIFDDGIGFLDENGKPYDALPRGEYTVTVTLSTVNGEPLASVSKPITVGDLQNQALCRFNPASHKARMVEWCRQIGCSISTDILPGYLDPYLGKWYYHMGLLPMYRASDIALYANAQIHAFLYLIDPTSTSYETELAYLQERGVIESPSRLVFYHYDVGEAILKQGTPFEQKARILPFEKDEFLSVCRMDVVNERAKENLFDLNGEAVKEHQTDLDRLTVRAGETVALMGVVRPWQLDPEDFHRRPDNTYEILNRVETINYTVTDGETEDRHTRPLMLERIDGNSIGRSVYEFYNLFRISEKWAGKTVTVTVQAADRNQKHPLAKKTLKIDVG